MCWRLGERGFNERLGVGARAHCMSRRFIGHTNADDVGNLDTKSAQRRQRKSGWFEHGLAEVSARWDAEISDV